MSIDYTKGCSSRLPCGLCLITNQACPFFTQSFDVTCSMPADANNITTTYTGMVGSDSTNSKYTSDYNDLPD